MLPGDIIWLLTVSLLCLSTTRPVKLDSFPSLPLKQKNYSVDPVHSAEDLLVVLVGLPANVSRFWPE